jgi:cytochrome c553
VAVNLQRRRSDYQKTSRMLLLLALVTTLMVPFTVKAEDMPNTLCTGCHNEDGNSTAPEFPKLAGLDPVYITKQITDFKKYRRVSEIMGPMAAQIPDADVPKLAAYFSKQKRTTGTTGVVTDAKLASLGQQIYDDGIVSSAVPACSGCHGEKGEGTELFPRLAGQHTVYMMTQLNNFKNIVRNNDAKKVMRAIASRMNDQEMKAAAEYITSLKGE